MRIIRTDKQKDNLTKYWWELSKIAVAALVIAPFVKPEAVDLRVVGLGLLSDTLSALFGYLLDGKEIKL
jgi:hypothetical protein